MGFTIGVVGASGGVGASTLTAAVATRALTRLEPGERALVVDLDTRGGIDTTLGIEHLPGSRWEDLRGGEWSLDGWADAVSLEELPEDDGLVVLTGRGGSGTAPQVAARILDALAPAVGVLTVDCGPFPAAAVLARLDLLVVLAATTPRGARDAQTLVGSCALARTTPVLVTRGPGRDRSGPTFARQLGLRFLAHLRDDVTVLEQGRRGSPPGVSPSAVDQVAEAALDLAEIRWLDTLVSRIGQPDDGPDRSPSWIA